jgi:membrane protease YdiL (CAAX protease family)
VGAGALIEGGFHADGRPSLFSGQPVNFLGHAYRPAPGFVLGETYFAALFLPVGVGEEALFRGVLQPGLTESLGPWGGWALASVIFGGVHVLNFVDKPGGLEDAAVAVPFITAVGAYFGYVSMKSGYTLSRNVALHAWYDFLISTVDFLVDPQHQPFVARFGGAF